MAKKVVGLKLGASRLNAACVSVNGSAEVVQLAGLAAASGGLIAGGEVREVEALGEALKEFFGKHKLPKRNVRIGLANNRIGVRTIEVAGIDDPKQLANAVRFRAQEALPIPIDEAVLDFQILCDGPLRPTAARRRSASSSSSPTAISSRPTSRLAGSPAYASQASISRPSRSCAR